MFTKRILSYAAAKELGHPILVVTEEEAAARRMCDDINIMEGKGETFAFLFPERDFTFRSGRDGIQRV